MEFNYAQGASGGGGGYDQQQQYPPTSSAQSPYVGSIMTPEPIPAFGGPAATDNFDDEPPLLEGEDSWFFKDI